jgi:hypothetical protein
MRQIKLIWDFRGQMSAKTAEHHEIHLKEFLEKENYSIKITGFEVVNDIYSTAFLVVNEIDMITFRDALRPHRGEIYEN